MSVYRAMIGLIFEDNFDSLEDRWVSSPSNLVSIDNNALKLEHNPTDRDTNCLFDLPNEENLLIQVVADYTPTEVGDMGGISIWKNALEKVEFLESSDTTTENTYSTWRALKRQNLWSFFADSGGAWELFDSTICIDPVRAGVLLKGIPRDGYKPLIVNRLTVCRGDSILISNVNGGDKIELVGEGTSIEVIVDENNSGTFIRLPVIPFIGKINIYTKEDGEWKFADSMAEEVPIYGGDVFVKGAEISVSWDGKLLNELTPTNLGSLKLGKVEHKMTVINDTVGSTATNVRIKIAAYLDEYGWRWCDLATDNDGTPNEYMDIEIAIGDIPSKGTKDFWLRVAKVDDMVSHMPRPTKFSLMVLTD